MTTKRYRLHIFKQGKKLHFIRDGERSAIQSSLQEIEESHCVADPQALKERMDCKEVEEIKPLILRSAKAFYNCVITEYSALLRGNECFFSVEKVHYRVESAHCNIKYYLRFLNVFLRGR